MHAPLLLAALALASGPFSLAAPTPRASSAPSADASSVTTATGVVLPLSRRAASGSALTRADGTADLDGALIHLDRARAKYARGVANFRANTGESHFLSPDMVDPSVLPPNTTAAIFDVAIVDASIEADANAPAGQKQRRDKIFGESGIRLHGVPKDVSPPPAVVSRRGNRRALDLEKRVIRNPKVIPNPKYTKTQTASSSAQTGSVSLRNYGEGTIFYGGLKVGSNNQAFTVNIDTGSADLWLPSVACNSAACNAHTKYDPSQSSTSSLVQGKTLNIRYGDGSSTVGTVYTDTVSIGGLSASSQALGAATGMSSDFQSDPYDGLLGMAYGSISTMGVPPLFETLVNQGRVAKPQFSTYLAGSGSELFLGGMHSGRFVAGSTRFYPVISQGYWTLAARAAVNQKNVGSLGTFNAVIDTGTSVIVAPTAAAQQFWASVPNSAPYGSGGYWTYLCASPPKISFSFGSDFGQQWTVSPSALNLGRISTGSDRCVGAVVGADIGINAWILGDTFLQSVYTTFDLGANQVGFSALA